ncbi:MAG: 4-diphosphocytidyl-2C-methyl-D-erythritol synthase [Geminicoccaceae bacterium]|nr:4-diphosphocytidyl-2C-methyl-D-erythritol synthase [Solirubrobacterales bacterium]MCE3246252.1 4-diphosphocytidyl-2C-methyl-D-erythritol synthase [Geminicoccaceae bacterium]
MIVGAVLAGGLSRRMGEPKASVELAGRPLVARVVSTVGSAGLKPIVVAKPDSALPPLDCRVLSEPSEPRHPLTGLLAALGASAGRGVVAIACDMPLVPANFLRWLAQIEAPVAVCEVGGRLEPLLGRYSQRAAPVLAAALAEGAPMREAVAALDPHVVGEEEIARFGDPKRIVFNVNSPADLRIAERLLGRTGPALKATPARR